MSALKLGCKTNRVEVTVPYSKLNAAVLSKFYEKGLISNYSYNAVFEKF